MKKLLVILISFLLVASCCVCHAESVTHTYTVGKDIAAGEYTLELYETDGNILNLGLALISHIRLTDKGIHTEEIKLQTGDKISCDFTLLEDDRLIIVSGDGYDVRIVNRSGKQSADKYANAIAGVNLATAFSQCRDAMTSEDMSGYFPGLMDVEFDYDTTMPSLNITMMFKDKEKIEADSVISYSLVIFNTLCSLQNPDISKSSALDFGSVFDDLFVIVGIYDESILYGGDMDTYYVLPDSTTIRQYN